MFVNASHEVTGIRSLPIKLVTHIDIYHIEPAATLALFKFKYVLTCAWEKSKPGCSLWNRSSLQHTHHTSHITHHISHITHHVKTDTQVSQVSTKRKYHHRIQHEHRVKRFIIIYIYYAVLTRLLLVVFSALLRPVRCDLST